MVIDVPSTDETYEFDEPKLKQMMKVHHARKEGSQVDMIIEMAKVLGECCQENFNIKNLTIHDVHYMFFRLQEENAKIIEMESDTSEVKFEINESPIVIRCKPPTIGLLMKANKIEDERLAMYEIIDDCIESVSLAGETVFWKEEPEDEKLLFLDALPEEAYDGIAKYFLSRPIVEVD